MYQVATPATGFGQTNATPILSTAPRPHVVVVGPRRVWTRGPKGGLLVRKRGAPGTWQPARRPVSTPAAGMSGCGCANGCGCAGMGQASTLSQIGTDFTTLLADVFENSDGSLNMTAVAVAGVAAGLIFLNWSHTTRRKK